MQLLKAVFTVYDDFIVLLMSEIKWPILEVLNVNCMYFSANNNAILEDDKMKGAHTDPLNSSC